MTAVHRNTDSRLCGATTIVSGQSTVFVNNKLWAVEGDANSHGSGELIASGSTVFINNKKIIIQGDHAAPDGLSPDILDGGVTPHDDPIASSGSPNVSCY